MLATVNANTGQFTLMHGTRNTRPCITVHSVWVRSASITYGLNWKICWQNKRILRYYCLKYRSSCVAFVVWGWVYTSTDSLLNQVRYWHNISWFILGNSATKKKKNTNIIFLSRYSFYTLYSMIKLLISLLVNLCILSLYMARYKGPKGAVKHTCT